MSILDMWSVENIILHWIHVSIIVGHLRSHKKSLGTKRIEFGFSSTSTQGTMMFDLSKKQHYESTSNFVNKHLNFNFILFHYFCCANKHHFVFSKICCLLLNCLLCFLSTNPGPTFLLFVAPRKCLLEIVLSILRSGCSANLT